MGYARGPVDQPGFFGGGFNTDRELVVIGDEQPVTSGAGEKPALVVFREAKSPADGLDGSGVLLQKELDGGVLQ